MFFENPRSGFGSGYSDDFIIIFHDSEIKCSKLSSLNKATSSPITILFVFSRILLKNNGLMKKLTLPLKSIGKVFSIHPISLSPLHLILLSYYVLTFFLKPFI